ncbi:hypothetical protein M3Y94_01029000 [Aphelenchoides besseyi]|nr:hypothetical protein M3Y94_01029000 [Aphelenchoides besseyi]KAI6223889.1 Histone acetyltransferase [Aphelenchoides besseyi]
MASQDVSSPQEQPLNISDKEQEIVPHPLLLVLHAQKCQQSEVGPSTQCSLRNCGAMKSTLDHIQQCNDHHSCTFSHCSRTKKIMSHWENCCEEDCKLCKTARNSDVSELLNMSQTATDFNILSLVDSSSSSNVEACRDCGSNDDKQFCNDCTHKSRNESVEKCTQSLVHACQCQDADCHHLHCMKMKRVVQHTKLCKRRQTMNCSLCKQLIAICCYHAKHCNLADCPVPFCLDIRQKLQEHEQSQNQCPTPSHEQNTNEASTTIPNDPFL